MATPDSIPPTTPEIPPRPREDVPTREPDRRDMPDTPDNPAPNPEDLPAEADSGDDDNFDLGRAEAGEPSPSNGNTGEGSRQMDDNADDLGRKPDGSTQDQPET